MAGSAAAHEFCNGVQETSVTSYAIGWQRQVRAF